ncbi:MAG TPA: hypothetical protein VLG11_02200 [Candidatus Saccharimonadales bacterium]|nr:hypothetical protein [Candidatus Saccharimonadales bacterium]
MSTVESAAGMPAGDFGETLPAAVETGLADAIQDKIAVNGLATSLAGRSIFEGYTPAVLVNRPLTPNQELLEREAAELRTAQQDPRYF